VRWFDRPASYQMLKLLLERAGYEVCIASDGKTGRVPL
jgi:DNA-binding response OmpR family regulator